MASTKEKVSVNSGDIGPVPKAVFEPTTAIASVELPADALAVGFQNIEDLRSPYVAFPMERSKKWVEYRDAYRDLQQYEPLVVVPRMLGDDVIRVCHKDMTFRVWYLHGCECYAALSLENGAILKATKARVPGDKEMKDHCEAICLIHSADLKTLYPCKVSFRNALAGTCKRMEAVMKGSEGRAAVVTTPEWINEGPEYAATAKFPQQYRAMFDIRVFTQVARDNPANKYPLGRPTVIPATLDDLAVLQSHMKDAAFQKTLDSVIRSYQFRVNEIKSKMVSV